MFKNIITILEKYTDYPAEQITNETSLLTDIAINSLDYVKVIMDIEDEFDIEVPESAIGEINTVGELVTFIEDLVEE